MKTNEKQPSEGEQHGCRCQIPLPLQTEKAEASTLWHAVVYSAMLITTILPYLAASSWLLISDWGCSKPFFGWPSIEHMVTYNG